MDPSCILMCTNIPRGIHEDVLVELFCVAGPIEDVSLSKSGRSCFIIYEFPDAILTAKEIFKDVKMYGMPFKMFDQNDIKQMHEDQEKESLALELQKAAYAEVAKQYPFYNDDSMAPTYRNSARNRPVMGSYPPNCFMPPPMNFPPGPNHFTPPMNFTPPPMNFTPPPNNFNGPNIPQNPSYGNNYDPSVPTHRWGSAPEVNPSQPFNPSELDSFKSPYIQPVSRKSYEQSRKNYDNDGASYSNYSRNRSFDNSKRKSNEFSSSDSPKKSPVHKKFHDASPGQDGGEYLFKDTIAEYTYEEQTRREFYHTPKKSSRENDRYNDDSKYNSTPTSSDHSNRYKSRDHNRSPYSRSIYQQRLEQRDQKRSNNYHSNESRKYRR